MCVYVWRNHQSTNQKPFSTWHLNNFPPTLICVDRLLEFEYYFGGLIWRRRGSIANTLKLRLFCIMPSICYIHTLLTWHCIAYPSLQRMLFVFGWPSCQRSDLILVEVFQHAYILPHIGSMVLFCFICGNFMQTWYGTCIYFCWADQVVWYLCGWNMDWKDISKCSPRPKIY